jgi:hypothetical protein
MTRHNFEFRSSYSHIFLKENLDVPTLGLPLTTKRQNSIFWNLKIEVLKIARGQYKWRFIIPHKTKTPHATDQSKPYHAYLQEHCPSVLSFYEDKGKTPSTHCYRPLWVARFGRIQKRFGVAQKRRNNSHPNACPIAKHTNTCSFIENKHIDAD